MKPMRFFLDTHNRTNKTFPDKITSEEFESFFALYEKACYEEGVVPIRVHVGFEDGQAFCLNMAENADAVKRAHDKVGLPFDTIIEVTTATPGDTFFRRQSV